MVKHFYNFLQKLHLRPLERHSNQKIQHQKINLKHLNFLIYIKFIRMINILNIDSLVKSLSGLVLDL